MNAGSKALQISVASTFARYLASASEALDTRPLDPEEIDDPETREALRKAVRGMDKLKQELGCAFDDLADYCDSLVEEIGREGSE